MTLFSRSATDDVTILYLSDRLRALKQEDGSQVVIPECVIRSGHQE